MCSNKVIHIHSMVLKSPLALFLYSCVLLLVSLKYSFLFFFETSTVLFLFCVRFVKISSSRYYLPFPVSRLCSIVYISLHTARLSTIIIIRNGKFNTLWSTSNYPSSCFNNFATFISYHFFHYNVYVLRKMIFYTQ